MSETQGERYIEDNNLATMEMINEVMDLIENTQGMMRKSGREH